MGLKGIDISGWQKGIDLSAVESDFVIMKATQGTGFVSDDFERQYQQAKEAGKLLGIYHYAEGGDYAAEANHFLDVVGSRVGEAILCLDWEGQDNPTFGNGDNEWVKNFCDYIADKTGVKPIVYISKSVMPKVKNIGDYAFWIAQYADKKETGYQDTPWNEGKYDCLIRQYSATGKIAGYDSNLDLDKFYGTADDWKKYASPANDEEAAEPIINSPEGSTLELAVGVMSGKYGNGEDRKIVLGNRYDEVQKFINHISEVSASDLANETKVGIYGNGDDRKVVLGSRYDEVQKIINGETEKKATTSEAVYYKVKPNDSLSSIAAKYNTTVKKLAELNRIKNVNLIYIGNRLRVK